MPQFDFYSSFVQIFWVTISFAVFYFTVNKTILPNLAQVLKMRQKLFDYRIKLERGMSLSIFSILSLNNFKSLTSLEEVEAKH